jgi:LemA protein
MLGLPIAACIVIVVVVAIPVILVAALYNGLVQLRNRVNNAWSQIDVQLRKRYDLIPNLVETVKGYAKHEREVFEKVTQARQMGISAQSIKDQAAAENLISGALKSLFAVAEAYPELKASEQFMKLQESLNGIESNIAYARQFYNDSVMTLNNKIQTFPSNIVASLFSFKTREYFEIEEPAAREPVKVDFSK